MRTWNKWLKEKHIKQGLCLFLLFILHLNAFISLSYPGIIVCLAFLGFVIWKKLWQLLHCAILFLLTSVSPLLFSLVKLQFSALQFLLIFFISTAIVLAIPPARVTLSWIRIGKIDYISSILLYVTAIVSTAALIVWAHLSQYLGYGLQMVQGIAHYPKGLVFLVGVPLFALMNAFAEETIFRGVLQEALMAVFQLPLAVVLQASAFAAFHFAAGFPNGFIGYIMVLVYGSMLGYLRIRTDGMLAPYLAHVIADLVIGFYLCFQVFEIF